MTTKNLPAVPNITMKPYQFTLDRLAVLRSDLELLEKSSMPHTPEVFSKYALDCVSYGLGTLRGKHLAYSENRVVTPEPAISTAEETYYLLKAWDTVAEFAARYGMNLEPFAPRVAGE
jgi:hypothetical protein